MRIHHWLLTLALGLGLGLILLPTQAAEKANATQIARLIDRMGSSDFEEREEATRQLDEIGLPALAALRKAMDSEDAEVRRRAEELVAAIEKRTEGQVLLAPTRIRLVFNNTPLPEATAELGRLGGCRIVLEDPEGTLAKRTVTLDTGETTFWQAFDLFCARAGLVEAVAAAPQPAPLPQPVPGVRILPGIQKGVPVPARPGQVKPIQVRPIQVQPALPVPIRRNPIERPGVVPAEQDQPLPAPAKDEEQQPEKEPAPQPARPADIRRIQIQAQPGVVIPLPQGVPVGPGGMRPGQPDTIVLTEGKPTTRPTDYSSAVRVRANPEAAGLNKAGPGQILVGLEASPEPKLQWQRLIGVRIDRALDDRGQELEQLMAPVPAAVAPALPGFVLPGGPLPGGAFPFAGPGGNVIPVYLKQGEKPSKEIAELKGTISAELLAPAEELIQVDNLAQAVGKTFKGKDGSTLKIIGTNSDGKGNHQICFHMQDAQGNAGIGILPGGIQVMPLPAPAPLPLPPQQAPQQNAPAPPPGAFQVQIQGQGVGQVQLQGQVQIQAGPNGLVIMQGFQGAGAASGLKVVDARGNVLEQQGISSTFRRGPQGVQREQVIRVKSAPGQGAPAKLIFSSRKSVTVDIPFTLKTIAIP